MCRAVALCCWLTKLQKLLRDSAGHLGGGRELDFLFRGGNNSSYGVQLFSVGTKGVEQGRNCVPYWAVATDNWKLVDDFYWTGCLRLCSCRFLVNLILSFVIYVDSSWTLLTLCEKAWKIWKGSIKYSNI